MLTPKDPYQTEFSQLFHIWNRKVYHYALKKTNNSYIAEETVQRVFLKLWNNLRNKNLSITIQAQLFCITKSVLIDILKEENKVKLSNISNLQTNPETPLEVYRLKEIQNKLNTIINKMPPIRRKVFLLSREENFTYKEIASKLGITSKTVENHIALAIKTLRKSFYIFILFLFI